MSRSWLAAVGLAAVAFAGCGPSNTSTPSEGQIESALEARGIHVCNSGTAPSHYHGAGTAQWYALSHSCSSSSTREAIVGVIPFDKKVDRNSAFRQTLYGARRVPNNIVVLTFKNSLVVMTHIKNRHLSQQTIGQLKSLGAK